MGILNAKQINGILVEDVLVRSDQQPKTLAISQSIIMSALSET